MSALIPVAGAATGPIAPPPATAATGGSGTGSAMTRTLHEGVDFDAMGEEVYRDEYIRIVAFGGIPIYTGVGYTEDLTTKTLPLDAICGPGNGLKTFDAMYETVFKANVEKRFSKDVLTGIEKSFLNTPPLDEKTMLEFRAEATGDSSAPFWAKTNRIADPKHRRNTRLKTSDQYRFQRILDDPTYTSRIYFRAPASWPHEETGDKIQLRENLKGCFLPDFHFNAPYTHIFAGAEQTLIAQHGVVINVDPNNSYVFSSDARTVFIQAPGEIIYGAKMTLSEYLLRLKSRGVGQGQPQMEMYITPPGGFFPSEMFNACITNTNSETPTLYNPKTKTSVVLTKPVRSPALEKLHFDVAQESQRIRGEILMKFFGEEIKFLAEFEDWMNQNVPSNAGPLFRDTLAALNKLNLELLPHIRHAKSQVFPHCEFALGVKNLELLTQSLAERKKFDIEGLVPVGDPILDENFHTLMVDFEKIIKSGKNLENIEDTKIGMLLVDLERLLNSGALDVTLAPPPAWVPPSTAKPYIYTKDVDIKKPLTDVELSQVAKKQTKKATEIKALKSAIASAKAEIGTLEKETGGTSRKVEERKGKIETLKASIPGLEAQLSTLESEHEELRKLYLSRGGRRRLTRRRRGSRKSKRGSRRH